MNRFLSVLARPAKVLLRLPIELLKAPRRIGGLSLPNRIAVVTALIVFALVAAVAWVRYDEQGATVDPFRTWRFWVLLISLVVAISFAVRWCIIAWLVGPASRFPEIDRAWGAGLAALREQCLDPAEIPIFVVHGLKDERQATSLIEASQARFPVHSVPGGVAELQWYASSEAILLVCMGQSQITALANASSMPQREEDAPRNMRDTLRGTIQAMELQQVRKPANRPGPAAPAGVVAGANLLTKTLMPGEEPVGGNPARSSGSSSSLRQVNAHELTAKLNHVCQRLRHLRQPACPINGILTVLPLELVIDPSVDQSQVQQAMRGDLETLRRGLQLRCPAVTLVAGMETEIGFRELVRRVGSELAKNSRFGKGVDVWTAPSPEQVEAVTANACVSFDTWAYKLFSDENGLTKPGNPKLYSLICRIRTELRERLQNVLVGAYAHGSGPQDALNDDPLLFGGCYFAETGDRPDLQAFVRGVLDLLIKFQDKLEWTDEAKREEAFYQRLASAGFVVDGILVLALVGLIVSMFFNTQG